MIIHPDIFCSSMIHPEHWADEKTDLIDVNRVG